MISESKIGSWEHHTSHLHITGVTEEHRLQPVALFQAAISLFQATGCSRLRYFRRTISFVHNLAGAIGCLCVEPTARRHCMRGHLDLKPRFAADGWRLTGRVSVWAPFPLSRHAFAFAIAARRSRARWDFPKPT